MKRLLVAAALAAAIALTGSTAGGAHTAQPGPLTTCGANCEGGGPSCTWSGNVAANQSFTPCGQGVWHYADIATTGCCPAGGSSFTYFWNGYSDLRFGNVSGLRIYAAHPTTVEGFTLQNNSPRAIWYYVHLVG